ncbi:hypothetical protein EDC94DRAFT_542155 [Helicostylum pulchrum]|uniref:Uncharacterized protein n=1 Tax=Helicostylum pulchrum TaxID=562976 RepID=A0ABP9YAA5_9FUNG|nr:hypothetical protein EDC94DRAFT_542155 [Helicostylum pulchrum]
MTLFPEPMPSISTPIHPSDASTELNRRPRRHTLITRPDSALGLSSDTEDDEQEQQEQQEAFDRISGILSSLIQEANEAVNDIEQERQFLKKRPSKTPKLFTSSTIITNHQQQDQSKIPRPRKSRTLNTTSSSHYRNSSSSSCTSTHSTNTTSALFSPVSTSTSATLSRSPSPTIPNFKKQLFRHHTVLRPRSCPVINVPNNRRSITPKHNKKSTNNYNNSHLSDPIAESFKRLDTSMALVESLSRDLATPTPPTHNNNNNNDYTFLLLVPLLHIPHSLITMIFDFVTSSPNHQSQLTKNTSFSLTSMIFWACVFAVTNLMVDQVSVPKQYISSITRKMKTRRLSLPGTYEPNKPVKSARVTTTTLKPKRTWIPATIQQQYQFRLGHDLPLPPNRRNSI